MTKLLLGSTISACILLVAIPVVVSADTIFFDDFSDGNLQDGDPAGWVSQFAGSLSVEDQSLIVSGGNGSLYAALPREVVLSDVSIRTQLRLETGGEIGVAVRYQQSAADASYFAYVGPTIGFSRGNGPNFVDLPAAFDVKEQDAILQLDVIGNSIKFWVWPADEPMPSEPTGTATDDVLSDGELLLAVWSEGSGNGPAKAAFRYVHVADSHIPEPSTLLLAMFGTVGTCCYRRRR